MAGSGSALGCSTVVNLCCLSRSLLVVDQVLRYVAFEAAAGSRAGGRRATANRWMSPGV